MPQALFFHFFSDTVEGKLNLDPYCGRGYAQTLCDFGCVHSIVVVEGEHFLAGLGKTV